MRTAIAMGAVLISIVCVLIVVCMVLCMRIVRGKGRPKEKLLPRLKGWWKTHKPTKRRLIQVYAALLVNANIRGFATGRIYKGNTKYLCTPGLNCYSCPGAVGACPLGALQNALASSGTRAPYYVFGILMLYGILLGRTICGFLCPVGLGQDLLYKIKTPKVRKGRLTRIFSWLKYVLLAAIVVAVPVMFGAFGSRVPAFCKYICPAGTLGGGFGLLVSPSNSDLFGGLGALFTWKTVLLFAFVTAAIFIYRFFCRFLCPLGALYGLFNRFALLGVKLDKNKCTDCGLCVAHCKMDIRRVGDHECINCGECIAVCPAHAISWKGSKLFVHANAVEPLPAPEERPLASLLERRLVPAAEGEDLGHAPLASCETTAGEGKTPPPVPASAQTADLGHGVPKKPAKRKHGRAFWLQFAAWAAALALLAGALIYYNFFYSEPSVTAGAPYTLCVTTQDGAAEKVTFSVSSSGTPAAIEPLSGSGTRDDPFELERAEGLYEAEVAAGESVFFNFTVREDAAYSVESESANALLRFYYLDAQGEEITVATVEGLSKVQFTLSSAPENLPAYGNRVGDLCYDFALRTYGEGGVFRLSAHRGKLVLVNFWYTECGPCKEEMPAIADLAAAHRGEMDVVAIHSARIFTNPASMEGVQAWLDTTSLGGGEKVWSQSDVIFAQDNGAGLFSSETYALLGGKDSYPFTLLLDGEGRIRYIWQENVTRDSVEEAVSALLSA